MSQSMGGPASGVDIATTITQQLPYLRRYARALTGSQGTGTATPRRR